MTTDFKLARDKEVFRISGQVSCVCKWRIRNCLNRDVCLTLCFVMCDIVTLCFVTCEMHKFISKNIACVSWTNNLHSTFISNDVYLRLGHR